MQSRSGFSAFEIYLRTGRRLPTGVEVKFNPWHDPENGRFTFAGSGQYYGRGSPSASRHPANHNARARSGAAMSGQVGPRADQTDPDYSRFDPKDPRNHSIYTVKRGDTLTQIARQRRGLRVSDLAWLNGMPLERPLRIGQQLRIPHQGFLEAGREAWNKYLALGYYARTHGGKLPPNPANPPSLQSQILDTNWRRETRHGYEFQIDIISRSRKVYGLLSFTLSPVRSRRSQAQAGGADRRPGDDGGHYIAARFNGPRDGFNHFAQDANFNRGGYRALEDIWAREMRAGHGVFVEIEPHYTGTSQRPDNVLVTWYVDGTRFQKRFPNEATNRSDGKR